LLLLQLAFSRRKIFFPDGNKFVLIQIITMSFRFILTVCFFFIAIKGFSQDATVLLQKVKKKIDRVDDYMATGIMKTDIVFIKTPVSRIRAYFKRPDQFLIKRDGGLSLLPKKGIAINVNSIIPADGYTVIDVGTVVLWGTQLRMVKLLPMDENSDMVLSTLYIDEKQLLIRKVTTTTRENGTYEIEMHYGKYSEWGLPDKALFLFNTKDYKLPKGITFEYDDGSVKKELPKNKKGRIEIVYNSYIINRGAGKLP
jgi:outer membrane lipoprotein-sorting protein